MIKLAFFVGGIILIPALSVLNLWLIITIGTAGFIVDILLCIGMAVVLTVIPRKIQKRTGTSAAGLLLSSTLIPLIVAIIMLIVALNSSLWDGLGIFFMALSMTVTDILIMAMSAFGIGDDTASQSAAEIKENSDEKND